MNADAAKGGERRLVAIGALALFAIVAAYGGLSLVAYSWPVHLPAGSFLQASLLGPPALLAWRGSGVPFWVCTAAIVGMIAVGGAFPKLRLIAAIGLVVFWLGAGFLSALLSV